jgi:hypothetical protein
MAPGQAFCAQCGRPSAAVIPPVPGLQFQVESYAGKIRTLSVLWFVYAGFSVLLGFFGLAFAHAFFAGQFGNWMNGPMPPNILGPFLIHFVWAVLVFRAVLYAVAGWGLMQRTQWGRVFAIVAAILSLIKFPFGTALGIWTLVVLLGYRNGTLYEQL